MSDSYFEAVWLLRAVSRFVTNGWQQRFHLIKQDSKWHSSHRSLIIREEATVDHRDEQRTRFYPHNILNRFIRQSVVPVVVLQLSKTLNRFDNQRFCSCPTGQSLFVCVNGFFISVVLYHSIEIAVMIRTFLFLVEDFSLCLLCNIRLTFIRQAASLVPGQST